MSVPLYGCRKASASWQDYQAEQLVHTDGFRRSVAEGCAFRNDELDVNALIHGDDTFAIGNRAGVVKFLE